jgi:hypothetical protein
MDIVQSPSSLPGMAARIVLSFFSPWMEEHPPIADPEPLEQFDRLTGWVTDWVAPDP